MLKTHSYWWAGADVLLSTQMTKMSPEFQSGGCSLWGAESVYLLSPGVGGHCSALSLLCGLWETTSYD